MIGVLIPAHNEEALIGRCLASVLEAARHPGLRGEPVCVVVALDRCNDGTARIAAEFRVQTVALGHGNVGLARHAAACMALARGARWLACTDADSVVPRNWVHGQLSCAADAFCGMIRVDDWEGHSREAISRFHASHLARDGHPHVHGANLGIASAWYRRCGGFRPFPAHEDVTLVDALESAGARVARRAAPTVTTSARRTARAPYGFSDYLEGLEILRDAQKQCLARRYRRNDQHLLNDLREK